MPESRTRRCAGATHRARSRVAPYMLLLATLAVLLAGCGAASSPGGPLGAAVALSAQGQSATTAFDPNVAAPLPNDRIVAAYGIFGGIAENGPASSMDLLTSFYPQLQQLGQQYQALDPLHPVKLALDLVINVIQPCSAYPKWCASWPDNFSQAIQPYLDFAQQHNMLLFFDLQLGVEPVADAITNYLLPYLEKYPFVELALDTEFHFPNTPQGYADAAGYPCCLGWMNASEVNWTINELAQVSMQYHLPRKVLVVHQWQAAVLPDKDQIRLNPNVSLVLQSDGFGAYSNKLGDYQIFVQQDLLEYGGYKLFFSYPGGLDFDYADYNNPQVQTPQQVLQLFPQPLFISYQ